MVSQLACDLYGNGQWDSLAPVRTELGTARLIIWHACFRTWNTTPVANAVATTIVVEAQAKWVSLIVSNNGFVVALLMTTSQSRARGHKTDCLALGAQLNHRLRLSGTVSDRVVGVRSAT